MTHPELVAQYGHLTWDEASWRASSPDETGPRVFGVCMSTMPAQVYGPQGIDPDESFEAVNLGGAHLVLGEISAFRATARQAIAYADRSGDEFRMMAERAAYAYALHLAGRRSEAEQQFGDAERRQ